MTETLARQISTRTHIRPQELSSLLVTLGDTIRVLSIDCFDTLLWRQTTTPSDVFARLAEHPLALRLGLTAKKRIQAHARAYREMAVTSGVRHIHLRDIYRQFTTLNTDEQAALMLAELETEAALCFAFQPMIDLIREALQRHIKVVIVSDSYFTSEELRFLLAQQAPSEVMTAISHVFTSTDCGVGKRDGLFAQVVATCQVPPETIVHIGDNLEADAEAPRKHQLQALHFVPFESKIADFLRLQQAAASLTGLVHVPQQAIAGPRYAPYHPLFATAALQPYPPETLIGYLSFGPVLYAYARFLMDSIADLQQQGMRVKVFFLVRDAYLLSRACEAYTRAKVGKLAHISRFVAIAASFKTQADISYYLCDTTPTRDHFTAIAEQLLLPPDMAQNLISMAEHASDPQTTFYTLLQQPAIMQEIFLRSAAYRARLLRYLQQEMQIEAGDTLVLADIDSADGVQMYLARTFAAELGVEWMGRYLLSTPEWDYPQSAALLTTQVAECTLFKQSCALKEGVVLDYDETGYPLFAPVSLGQEQYRYAQALQAECVRFIHDARQYFQIVGKEPLYPVLQQAAHAALLRHVHLPVAEELVFFSIFQHEKTPEGNKSVYDVPRCLQTLSQRPSLADSHTYEIRAVGLDHALSALLQRITTMDLFAHDFSARYLSLKVIVAEGEALSSQHVLAQHQQEGYYRLVLPVLPQVGFGIVWGELYQWVQLESSQIVNSQGQMVTGLIPQLVLSEIEQQNNLLKCLSVNSLMMLKPVAVLATHQCYYQLTFRPLVGRP